MEDFPGITDKIRLPLEIEIHPYLFDHHFEGKAVLPAVEAMQLLAASTRAHLPDAEMRCITNAAFEKFLHIQPNDVRIEAFNEIVIYENGDVSSSLLTITRSKKASITRVKTHVSMEFSSRKQELPDLSAHLISALKGTYFDIPSDKIYSDLVPFGPAYHNIRGNLHVSEKETVANIIAPVHHNNGLPSPLGSCFPLDAAFHAACVWGQRFPGIVAFPVGLEKRFILRPTRAGENYIARIVPKLEAGNSKLKTLIFDIWIYNLKGVLCEVIAGVRMRDVSAGRMKPPQWVMNSFEKEE